MQLLLWIVGFIIALVIIKAIFGNKFWGALLVVIGLFLLTSIAIIGVILIIIGVILLLAIPRE